MRVTSAVCGIIGPPYNRHPMERAIDWREVSRRAGPWFLALVVASWAWAAHRGAERPQPDLYPFLKRAWPGADYAPSPGGGFEVSRAGRRLGWAAAGTASGYATPLTVAVGTAADGHDPRRGAPRVWRHARADEKRPAVPALAARQARVGRVRGRPRRGCRERRHVLLARPRARGGAGDEGCSTRAAPRATRRGPASLSAPRRSCLLLLIALGAVGRNRPSLPARSRRVLRVARSPSASLTIGFLYDRPWMIAFPTRLLAGDWPSWHTHLYWYLLLGFAAPGLLAHRPQRLLSLDLPVRRGAGRGRHPVRRPPAPGPARPALHVGEARPALARRPAGPAVPQSRRGELRGLRGVLPAERHRLPVRAARDRARRRALRLAAVLRLGLPGRHDRAAGAFRSASAPFASPESARRRRRGAVPSSWKWPPTATPQPRCSAGCATAC